jgi:zinc-ribbon domain
MPFCTSCGKEVPPGKKFCEYCGTPLEQPVDAPAASVIPAPVPLAPVTPPAAPQPSSGGSGKTMLIAGILIFLVVIAGVYFIGLPMLSRASVTGTAVQPTPIQPTLVQTPFSGPFTPGTTAVPLPADTPAASQTYEEKYMESYNQVYAVNRAFVGGQKEVFSQDLRNPPLYVKFKIIPEIEVGEKVDDAGKMVSTSYVSPNAWFKVSIYDAGNGALVEQQGFNKGFGITEQQEFMVRAPGNYRVEISGNAVTADVRILTGKS